MDTAQIARLRDDLQGIVRGELLFDDLSRVLYASDASLFEVRPAAVVVPRDEEDLCALVRYAGCRSRGAALTEGPIFRTLGPLITNQ